MMEKVIDGVKYVFSEQPDSLVPCDGCAGEGHSQLCSDLGEECCKAENSTKVWIVSPEESSPS